MDKIAAVIITYNIGERFKKSIKALKPQVNEIIVVDNGSNKETLSMLESLKQDITIINLGSNKGIAHALNEGIKYALKKEYQWILTLDHDSIASHNMVSAMLNSYYTIDKSIQEKIAMITPVHVEESQELVDSTINNSWSEVLTEITSGALVKASIYREVGLYDEKLFIDLVDHDYCLSLNKKGYKIIQVKSSILIHNLGESEEKKVLGVKMTPTNHSPIRRYYMTRNRLYMWKKYGQDFPGWVWLDRRRFVSEIVKIVLFENNKKKKMKMISKGIEDYNKQIWGCKQEV